MKNTLSILAGLLVLVALGLGLTVTEDAPYDLIRGRADVQIRQARGLGEPVEVTVEAFGTTHELQLQPTEGVLAEDFEFLLTRRDSSGNVTLVKDDSEYEEEDSLYHDYSKGAVVRLEGDSVEGIISHNIFLQSKDGEHEAILVSYEDDYSDIPDFLEVSDLDFDEEESSLRTEMSDPVKSVTAELHIVVDSTLNSYFRTSKQVKKYLSIFWQAVNHRFATLSDPTVNIVLRGATIISDAGHEPFITSNTYVKDCISAGKTLKSISLWLYEQRAKLGKYDVAYLMTGKNLVSGPPEDMERSTAGLAYKGKACLVKPNALQSVNTAIGEDRKGAYTGVFTAAHEIAHTFNADHDSKEPDARCHWSEGYIMSYVRGKKNAFYFSPCSISAMRAFFQTDGASCLQKTSGKPKIPLAAKLPGNIYSLDEQCRHITGRPTATAVQAASDDAVCLHLKCRFHTKIGGGGRSGFMIVNTGHPPAEGTKCLNGGRCLNGICQ